MADAKLIAAMQKHAAIAEGEHRRLVGELETMRLRAVQAEAMLASVSGVTRLELVANERAKRDGLLAALRFYVGVCGHTGASVSRETFREMHAQAISAIAAAEAES